MYTIRKQHPTAFIHNGHIRFYIGGLWAVIDPSGAVAHSKRSGYELYRRKYVAQKVADWHNAQVKA